MKDEPILVLDDVGKSYPRTRKQAQSRMGAAIKSALFGARPKGPDEQAAWAVRDISLRVARGECLGIIGRNGAGKTTLLRMIAGQLRPDRGEISIAGESGALIALTAGLKMSATGRENIFLKSAMLGRSRRQTDDVCDEVINFSELGDAIDRPVETYSSGMVVRLAFSIIIATQPDLLIVDEALAVGDFAFKQKCLARIREMKDQLALVLVSHSMGDVSRFCDRVVLVENGRIAFEGEPAEAIKRYQAAAQPNSSKMPQGAPLIPEVVKRPEVLEILEFSWTDGTGAPANTDIPFEPETGLGFQCRFILHRKPRRLVIGVPIYSATGELMCGLASDHAHEFRDLPLQTPISARFTTPHLLLNSGRYRAAIGIVDELEHLYMEEVPDFSVAPTGNLVWGHFSLPGVWQCDVGS